MKTARTGVALMMCATLAVGVAEAAPVVGTGSVSFISVSGGPIAEGSTFEFFLARWISGTGDFSAIPSALVLTTSPVTATLGAAVSFGAEFGSFVGSVSDVDFASSAAGVVLDVDALGTFTPGGSLGGLEATAMTLSFRAETLSSGGTEARYVYSFSTSPGTHGVPAPATAGLVAAALAGLLLSRRAAPLRA